MMHWVRKRSLPIPALTIADPALVLAYRHWSTCRDGDFLPTRCSVDTPSFRLLVPNSVWLVLGIYQGHLEPFSHIAHEQSVECLLGEELQGDTDTALLSGVPSLQLIELKVCGRSVLYQQLLLPTSDDGVHANEVLEVSKLGALRLVNSSAKAA